MHKLIQYSTHMKVPTQMLLHEAGLMALYKGKSQRCQLAVTYNWPQPSSTLKYTFVLWAELSLLSFFPVWPWQWEACIYNNYAVSLFYLQHTSVTVSVLTLTAISVERYIAICYPLTARPSLRRAIFILALIWMLALIIAVPQVRLDVVANNTELQHSQCAICVHFAGMHFIHTNLWLYQFEYNNPFAVYHVRCGFAVHFCLQIISMTTHHYKNLPEDIILLTQCQTVWLKRTVSLIKVSCLRQPIKVHKLVVLNFEYSWRAKQVSDCWENFVFWK